jgi:hypothetical protein
MAMTRKRDEIKAFERGVAKKRRASSSKKVSLFQNTNLTDWIGSKLAIWFPAAVVFNTTLFAMDSKKIGGGSVFGFFCRAFLEGNVVVGHIDLSSSNCGAVRWSEVRSPSIELQPSLMKILCY